MVSVLLKAAEYENQPLLQLEREMNWDTGLRQGDIDELKVYHKILSPMCKLFSELNSEKQSTLHLAFPYVMVSLNTNLIYS